MFQLSFTVLISEDYSSHEPQLQLEDSCERSCGDVMRLGNTVMSEVIQCLLEKCTLGAVVWGFPSDFELIFRS